jgi:cysteine desulfurase family protein (TIGR01976 family)
MTTLARPNTSATRPLPSLAALREQFPALRSSSSNQTVFLDNAGAAQLPACVPAAMLRHMTESYVQLNADYAVSQRATATIRAAHEFAKVFVNAVSAQDEDGSAAQGKGPGEVILGPSSTALCHIMAEAYARAHARNQLPHPERTDIIVCTAGHEANITPWLRLKERGFTVHEWPAERDPVDGVWRPRVSTLTSMLSPRTRLVTFPQVSNILGEVLDVAAITRLVHNAGGRVVVDGVAYAPHHAPDIKAWGCDWYVWSWYKVFGPHMAGMYGSREAFSEITGPNHDFLPRDMIPYMFELGGVNHESCAGLVGLQDYLRFAAGEAPEPHLISRATVERAFHHMHAIEHESLRVLIDGLRRRSDVTFYGPPYADAPTGSPARVATVAFTLAGRKSADVARALNAQNLGVRFGNFYSLRLCEQMGLDPKDGVIRASLAHYTTPQEVQQLLSALP